MIHTHNTVTQLMDKRLGTRANTSGKIQQVQLRQWLTMVLFFYPEIKTPDLESCGQLTFSRGMWNNTPSYYSNRQKTDETKYHLDGNNSSQSHSVQTLWDNLLHMYPNSALCKLFYVGLMQHRVNAFWLDLQTIRMLPIFSFSCLFTGQQKTCVGNEHV